MKSVPRVQAGALALLLLALGACAPMATVRGSDASGVRLPPYSGPKARIAVAAFEDKTSKGGGTLGDGMATMLTTALVGSNRFIVLERETLDLALREQDLGANRRVNAGTAAPIGEVEGAELLIFGAVTAFAPETMGIGGGIIGLGTLIGSAILNDKVGTPIGAATYTESYLSIDVRAVDAATSRVLFNTSIDARGYDWGGGVIAEIGGGHSALPVGFGGFQKTATQAAVRKAIDLAVAELAMRTPIEYFRHREEEFASGRMAAFAYVDIAGTTGERFGQASLRVASSAAEWTVLAAELGLQGQATAPPVDFSVQRVAAVFAGRQDASGSSISIEKAVAFPDRVELTAVLVRPAGDEEKIEPTPARLHPVALVRLENGAPVRVTWATRIP